MESSTFDKQLNRVLLKPRFSFELKEPKEAILEKFSNALLKGSDNFRGKVVGNHVVIDVAKADEHFWSPQLQIEVESTNQKASIIKGLFGPKPQLWTLFMFIHFGVALAFAIFVTMLYTDLSLDREYSLSLFLTILMPVIWISFYLFGRWGKRKGYKQIMKLYNFVVKLSEG